MMPTVRRRCLLVFLLVQVSNSVAVSFAEEPLAGLQWMSGDDIRSAFEGQDLAGVYPNQKAWTERIKSDGSTDYREGAKHWLGEWWVTNRDFCFSYPPPGVGGCFRVVRTSSNCFELYESNGETGQADAPPSILNAWNGRMWRSNEATTCERQISSTPVHGFEFNG